MGESATVLLSGGLDSTVLLHYLARERCCAPIFALSFDYGQKHDRELEMSRWQAARVPQVAEHTVQELRDFGALLRPGTTLVRGGAPVPDLAELSAAARQQPPTYVPNRNMILLALAAAYAEARGCQTVYYGAQAQDRYGYWDCTAEFVSRLNQVLALNRVAPVRLEAPFAATSKAEEIRIGLGLGVDFAHTWSCYRGDRTPCATCPTCVEREAAFAQAGVPDPLGARQE